LRLTKLEKDPYKIVVFFGADGVGKTTQVNLLSPEYQKRGLNTTMCWLRGRHSLSYVLSRMLLSLGYPNIVHERDIKLMDSRNLPMKGLWSFIEFISVIPLILSRFVFPRIRGNVVIAERFLPDTVVFNSFFIGREFNPYSAILLKMIPCKALLIHLNAEEKELKKRRSSDWPQDFIKHQIRQYKILAKKMGAVSINTSLNSVEETHNRIMAECKLL
jgi:thymidylate kinase